VPPALPSAGASCPALAVADKFKYLGVELHRSKDIRAAVGLRLSQMVAAQSGVNRRLNELRIPFDPNVLTGLFDAITAAAGSYGCEVWSTRFLGEWHLGGGPAVQAAELPGLRVQAQPGCAQVHYQPADLSGGRQVPEADPVASSDFAPLEQAG
jgi:hypothetical protein